MKNDTGLKSQLAAKMISDLQHSVPAVLWGACSSAVRFGKSLLGKELKYLASAKLCCWVKVSFRDLEVEDEQGMCSLHAVTFAFPIPV